MIAAPLLGHRSLAALRGFAPVVVAPCLLLAPGLLFATREFIAPRLWEDKRGIDGGFTANDAKVREWAIDRAKKCADIARAMDTKMIVL